MKITYLYHSGYMVETEKCVLLFDCINLSEVSINDQKPLYIFVSHHHRDHFQPEILGLNGMKFVGYDVLIPVEAKDVMVLKPGDEVEHQILKIKAFGSADAGVSFLIEIEQQFLFYAGDLNNWHWKLESTLDEIEAMNQQYLEIIQPLEGRKIDILFYPLDPRLGVDIDLGLRQLLELIQVRHIFPMHFSSDLGAIAAYYEASSFNDRIIPITQPNTTINLKGNEWKDYML